MNILIVFYKDNNLESFSSHGVHLVAFIHSSFHFSYDLFSNSFSKGVEIQIAAATVSSGSKVV
jgi:hypothetical protein